MRDLTLKAGLHKTITTSPQDMLLKHCALFAETGLALDRTQLQSIPPTNVSMHRRQVSFMAQFPKLAEARRSRDGIKFGQRVARALRASDAIADDGRRLLLSPRRYHDIIAVHAAGNRALAARSAFWPWRQSSTALRDTLRFRLGLARMGSAG